MQSNTPIKLEEEEINDPYLVISRFFDYADISSVRGYLWDWLKITVSGTYNTKLLDKHQRYDMIHFFEHIEKLIEAAYIIRSTEKKEN
ncbi:MAG TPA: hypothetical protein VK588_02195 [Chitinophagaceae bacterium]|nr:hypothetical protein [Chitinophagaceae bacterium]